MIKRKKINTNAILKTAIVFDAILNCEDEIGILLPKEYILSKIVDDAKRYNQKISKQEIEKILEVFLLGGIIFYPRKDYVERLSAYKKHKGEINKFLKNNGKK